MYCLMFIITIITIFDIAGWVLCHLSHAPARFCFSFQVGSTILPGPASDCIPCAYALYIAYIIGAYYHAWLVDWCGILLTSFFLPGWLQTVFSPISVSHVAGIDYRCTLLYPAWILHFFYKIFSYTFSHLMLMKPVSLTILTFLKMKK